MTNQEAFDKVWEYFVIEGHGPAVNEQGACKYRTENGTKCAIGCLIPDDEYFPELEGNAFTEALNERLGFLLDDPGFGAKLQSVHDGAADAFFIFSNEIKFRLTVLAKNYGLTIPG